MNARPYTKAARLKQSRLLSHAVTLVTSPGPLLPHTGDAQLQMVYLVSTSTPCQGAQTGLWVPRRGCGCPGPAVGWEHAVQPALGLASSGCSTRNAGHRHLPQTHPASAALKPNPACPSVTRHLSKPTQNSSQAAWLVNEYPSPAPFY